MRTIFECIGRRPIIMFALLIVGLFGSIDLVRSREKNIKVPVNLTSQTDPSQGDRKPIAVPIEKPRIVVRKAGRKLEFYSDQTLVRTYKIGLGFSPFADKKQEGDGATPEGEFYVFVKNNKSAYYLSLGISYPNAEDAERGLRDGLITRGQYKAILEAVRKRAAPPQYTRLGGLIYIHGNGAGSDWTWGCVALENEDIKELYDSVTVGTPVTILP